MQFWSVIKYKPKEGCEDDFIDALGGLKKINEGKRELRFIQLASGEIAEIVNYKNLDRMMDLQVDG